MVKITIEPARLKRLFSQALAYKSTPITDESLLHFTPAGIDISCSLASDVLMFAKYDKKFFIEYDCPQEEYIMATVRLVKERLAYGFNGDKMIFSTDDQYIYLVGDPSDDKVRDKLVEVNKSKICPYETRMIEPLGLIPHRKKKSSSEIEPMPFAIQFLIPIEKFSDLPPSEEVKIVSDSKSLKLTFDDNLGSRDRPIPIRKTVGTPQVCSVDFNMKILQQLTAQFEGEIWMSLNDGMVCLSQANKDNSLTYLFAAKEVS